MAEQILSKTPLLQYIEKFDLKYIDSTYNDYWKVATEQEYASWNALIEREIEFREQAIMNFVFSVEGTQGAGKSSFLIRKCQLIGEKYGKKFSLNNLHFFHEDMAKDLKNFKKRKTYAQDEQPRIFGMMSSFIQDELANYEDIFRKPQVNVGYASPSLRVHEHFFIYEALDDIFLDEKGKPCAVQVMLKTKRKSDQLIMPRGLVRLRWPDDKFWNAYNKKKDRFIKRMVGSKGNRIKILEDYAEQTFKKRKDDLYLENKSGDGFRLKNKEVFKYYIDKAVGGGNLTGGGMNVCVSILQEKVMAYLYK